MKSKPYAGHLLLLSVRNVDKVLKPGDASFECAPSSSQTHTRDDGPQLTRVRHTPPARIDSACR